VRLTSSLSVIVQGRGSTLRRKTRHGQRWRMQWLRPAPVCVACTMSSVKCLPQATAVLRAVAGRCRAPAANAQNEAGFPRGAAGREPVALPTAHKRPTLQGSGLYGCRPNRRAGRVANSEVEFAIADALQDQLKFCKRFVDGRRFTCPCEVRRPGNSADDQRFPEASPYPD
jgi:hypothetical protein